MKYTVIKDKQEKVNGWTFEKSDFCDDMVIQHLKTGDYTLLGYEKDFIIEKKSSTSEISKNIFDPAFERELQRMENFKYAFVICCFTLNDIFSFPLNSKIPQKYWRRLRVNKHIILKKINEFQLKYKAKWIFAGDHGHEEAESLFKMVIELERV